MGVGMIAVRVARMVVVTVIVARMFTVEVVIFGETDERTAPPR